MRNQNPRESAPLATGGPTTDLSLAKGRVLRSRLARVSRVRVDLATGDWAVLREGRGRHPGSQGPGEWSTVQQRVFEVQRPAPPRGSGREGQGGAGCRRKGARAKRSVFTARKGADGAGDWRTGAREAFRGLGRRSTVMRGFRSTPAYRRILGSRTQASESGSRHATATAGRPTAYVS